MLHANGPRANDILLSLGTVTEPEIFRSPKSGEPGIPGFAPALSWKVGHGLCDRVPALPSCKHERYRDLISVLDRFGKFLRVGAFGVDVDVNIVEQLSLFVEKLALDVGKPLHQLSQALAYGSACNLNCGLIIRDLA
jgi:hypothetical protein